jgi:hypothetical protein
LGRRIGSKAVPVICLVLAGCGPEIYVRGPSGVFRSGPTCEQATSLPPPSFEPGADDLAPDPFADDLAPDPFAEEVSLRGASVCELSGDNLAPDPFMSPTHEAKPRRPTPLAADDLAPDPFGSWNRQTKPRKGRPLAEDGLAPSPF